MEGPHAYEAIQIESGYPAMRYQTSINVRREVKARTQHIVFPQTHTWSFLTRTGNLPFWYFYWLTDLTYRSCGPPLHLGRTRLSVLFSWQGKRQFKTIPELRTWWKGVFGSASLLSRSVEFDLNDRHLWREEEIRKIRCEKRIGFEKAYRCLSRSFRKIARWWLVTIRTRARVSL